MSNVRFATSTGRLVQGDAFDAQTKDQNGNPLTIKTGPNAGQPTSRFFIAVAFRKDDPNAAAILNLIRTESAKAWPQLWPQGPQGQCVSPKFSTKIVDGDGVDQNGKSNATKEGFAGHWVIRFQSSFAPKVVHHAALGVQVTDPNALKRGYYVSVAGTIASNNNPSNAGMYVNMDFIRIDGYGPEIVSGPSAEDAFSSVGAPRLPVGASNAPLVQPLAVGAGVPAPSGVPMQPAIASPTSAPPVQPYTGYMQPAAVAVPPPPAAVAVPPPPLDPVMTPKAVGTSYAAFIAAGWTPEALRANGYIA